MDPLESYYKNEGLESLRLQPDGVQYTEFLTIMRYLNKVLPQNACILDPCSGAGVYAFELAANGHTVTAGDLFKINVEELTRRDSELSHPLDNIYLGDVRDLSRFGDASFDAVLCMGAVYHLHQERDRLQAISECLRVLKPGGILVVTYINRLAAASCSFMGDCDDIGEIMQFLQTGIEGVFYAHTPTEIEGMLALFPLTTLYHIGVDGIGNLLYGLSGSITPLGMERWREYHFATCECREVLGYSYHGAIFAQK